MAKKNIVSIEDRIPKLKEARKKRANRQLTLYLTIFFILISIIMYLQSPLSHVKHITVMGNQYISEAEVLQLSTIPTDQNIWQLNEEEIEDKLLKHAQVKSATVDKKFPNHVKIHVLEYNRVGYVRLDGSYNPILENGIRLQDIQLKAPNGDAPILINWQQDTYLEEMTKELKALPPSISLLISEVHYAPTEENPYKIKLFMNDGYEVHTSIRSFSSKMSIYPSIAAQLNSQDGIIHIDVGAYFQAYKNSNNTNLSNPSVNE